MGNLHLTMSKYEPVRVIQVGDALVRISRIGGQLLIDVMADEETVPIARAPAWFPPALREAANLAGWIDEAWNPVPSRRPPSKGGPKPRAGRAREPSMEGDPSHADPDAKGR